MRYKFILMFIFILIAISGSIAFAADRCDICGKTLEHDYYETKAHQLVCPDCYNTYGFCRDCGKVTRSLVNADGLKFCRDCYMKLPKCSICNKVITGEHRVYRDTHEAICMNCEKNSPRCQSCGRPVKQLIQSGSVGLCERCASGVQRCRSCGSPLLRDFTYFEGNNTLKYCTECVRKYKACADCGAPSGPDGILLEDNRHLCPDCMAEAMFQPGQVTPIKKVVLEYLLNNLGMKVNHQIVYQMKGRDVLGQMSGGVQGDLNGLFHREDDNYSIYVLYGLRKKDLILVIAHEYAHAWQSENTKGTSSLEDMEGFAQWVAYKSLVNFGFETYARTLTNGNTVYSRGLRKMIEKENSGGPSVVFDYIRSK